MLDRFLVSFEHVRELNLSRNGLEPLLTTALMAQAHGDDWYGAPQAQRLAEALALTGLTAEQCGYIGDDVIDLPLLTQVGFAVAVPSGHADVQHRVHYVTRAPGGRGAVREVCDLVMRAQGTYDAALAPYYA